MKPELTEAPTDLSLKSQKSISDYKIGRIIGKGSFGTVFIAQEKSSGQVFAIKSIRKSRIQSDQSYFFIKSEKEILSNIKSPFAVKFYGSFQDPTNIYLIQEYLPGGELFSLINSMKKLHISQAKLIAAEIVLFFTHIHKQNIVYRDLKPENILISALGHVKIVDFGFASTLTEEGSMFCGTLEYLAPEVVLRERHGQPVDWWTLGILIFEMLVGKSPFRSKLPSVILEKIIKTCPEFPRGFDLDAKDLVLKLLEKDPKIRIQAEDVKKHQFFKDVDWNEIEKLACPTFDVPVLRHQMDSSYFQCYNEMEGIVNRGVKYSFQGF